MDYFIAATLVYLMFSTPFTLVGVFMVVACVSAWRSAREDRRRDDASFEELELQPTDRQLDLDRMLRNGKPSPDRQDTLGV